MASLLRASQLEQIVQIVEQNANKMVYFSSGICLWLVARPFTLTILPSNLLNLRPLDRVDGESRPEPSGSRRDSSWFRADITYLHRGGDLGSIHDSNCLRNGPQVARAF